jgi:ABC-type metal ion transport system substrate-binding protein
VEVAKVFHQWTHEDTSSQWANGIVTESATDTTEVHAIFGLYGSEETEHVVWAQPN